MIPAGSSVSLPVVQAAPSEHTFPSVLVSHVADARANSKWLPCFVLHVCTLLFSFVLLGLCWTVFYSTIPLGLVSLATSTFAMYHLWSLRDMSTGCCCTPLGAYSWIFGMNVVVSALAVPTVGSCVFIALFQKGYNHDRLLGSILGLTSAVAAAVTVICSIVAMILLSALQEICTVNLCPQVSIGMGVPANFGGLVYPQVTPATEQGVEVPPSVLISHVADARANSKRLPCFVLHVCTLLFSLILLGLCWTVFYFTIPCGLVSLATSIFAMYHLWSLRDMSTGCCCTPLGAYSWIFGMDVVLLIFAVPTLGVCLWITSWGSGDADYGYWTIVGVTSAVFTYFIIVCTIVVLLLISDLRRICAENSRPQSNFPVVVPLSIPQQEPVAPTASGQIAAVS
jgi:hypothetical protein